MASRSWAGWHTLGWPGLAEAGAPSMARADLRVWGTQRMSVLCVWWLCSALSFNLLYGSKHITRHTYFQKKKTPMLEEQLCLNPYINVLWLPQWEWNSTWEEVHRVPKEQRRAHGPTSGPLSPGLGVFPLYNTAALAHVPVGDDGDDSSHSEHRMLQKQALVCFPNRHDSALYLNFLKNSCLLLIGQCGQVLLEF